MPVLDLPYFHPPNALVSGVTQLVMETLLTPGVVTAATCVAVYFIFDDDAPKGNWRITEPCRRVRPLLHSAVEFSASSLFSGRVLVGSLLSLTILTLVVGSKRGKCVSLWFDQCLSRPR